MPAKYTLTIPQGETYSVDFSLNRNSNNYDLTDTTIYATIKNTYNTDSYTEFYVEYLNRRTGSFRLSLSQSASNGLTPGENVYDVELHIPRDGAEDQVIRLLEGTAFITPAVTTQR